MKIKPETKIRIRFFYDAFIAYCIFLLPLILIILIKGIALKLGYIIK